MKNNFWGYIKNNKYAIGCTGWTVYVYDNMGNELKKFNDITYAYAPMFCPEKNIFIVKSTEGRLAVYSLDTMELIKKFRFSKVDGAQDDGFCFSNDGKWFYNIERHVNDLITCLSVYDTSSFERVKQLFLEDSFQVLSHIEYDTERKSLFVLGFMRAKKGILKKGVFDYGFVAELQEEKLINITKLTDEEYDYIRDFKHLELLGFTSKAKEWSGLKYDGYDLSNIESTTVRLSDYNK